VTFNVREGPHIYVERIDIVGNTRTEDKVIWREFRLAEGDPYSVEAVRLTRQRLLHLGYFESVEISASPGSRPDEAILTVQLQEKATGSGGATLHLDHGVPALDLALRESNFMGNGQSIVANIDLARGAQSRR
jgi:outer membrane protein insertion porin family